MIARIRLTFLVAIALALAGAAARAEDTPRPEGDSSPLPYLQSSPDEGWIEGYLRDPRRRGKTFVAGVDSSRPGCFAEPGGHEGFEIWFRRHGLALRFDQVGTSLRGLDTIARPDGAGYLGSATFPGCMVRIAVRKSVLRDGAWRPGRIAAPAAIGDWDAREARRGYPAPPSAPEMHFFFDAERDDCGWGSDFGMLRGHVITGDIPIHGGLRSLRQPGSLTTNDWALGTATCRYDVSISFWTPDADGVLRPTPVSQLFAAVRLPPTP